MTTASIQETLIRTEFCGCFLKLCHLASPHLHICLHDLVTPPLGLFLLQEKAKAGRVGGQGGRRGGGEGEPIAGLQGAKQSAEPLVSGVTQ